MLMCLFIFVFNLSLNLENIAYIVRDLYDRGPCHKDLTNYPTLHRLDNAPHVECNQASIDTRSKVKAHVKCTRNCLIFGDIIYVTSQGQRIFIPQIIIQMLVPFRDFATLFDTLSLNLSNLVSQSGILSLNLCLGSLSHNLGTPSVQVGSPSHILNKCVKDMP